MRAREQSGFTLIELLVGMIITLVVFSGVLYALQVFQQESHNDQARNEIQDNARTTIDRMSHQLRNVAAPSPSSAGALELAGPYDIVFETVNPTVVYPNNPTNQMRVRYCLDASSSTNETLWFQTQTWTSATVPSVPSTSTCPGPLTGTNPWTTKQVLVSNVTNEIYNQDRELFSYAPIGATSPAQINSVEVDVFLDSNPGKQPGETELKSGIYLRNSFAAPIASFTLSQVNGQVLLDASSSTDPNGQALSYQWSLDGTSIPAGTTQQYNAGSFTHGSVHTFGLTVTSTGGLTDQTSKMVTIQ